MSGPRRERLAEALAVVTGDDVDDIRRVLARDMWMVTPDGLAECGIEPPPDLVHGLVITDPHEAWEALATAGLIAHGDVERARRRFRAIDSVFGIEVFDHGGAIVSGKMRVPLVTDYRGEPMPIDDTRRVRIGAELVDGVYAEMVANRLDALDLPYPGSVAECVSFAADWGNVLAAEAIARETIAHIVDWTPRPKPLRVLWRVGEYTPRPYFERGFGFTWAHIQQIFDAVHDGGDLDRLRNVLEERRPAHMPWNARRIVDGFAALAATDYALGEVVSDETTTITLVAPPL